MSSKGKVAVAHIFTLIPRLSACVKERLPEVNFIDVPVEGEFDFQYKVTESELKALKDAEILLIDNNLIGQVVHHVPKARWIQGTWAGIEGLIDALKDKPKPTFPVTRLVGEAFSQLMTEHIIGWIIAHERGWLKTRENQLESKWSQEGQIGSYRSLRDITVGIMGMGNIGKEVAQALKTFKAGVNALTRSPPSEENKCKYVDKYWHSGDMSGFLQESDYIVNIMPSTPATRGILNGDVLKNSKRGAVFINVGRGDVIDEADLIRTLDLGWISTAILDVFVKEPLSSKSPLWKHPKIVITPHVAGVSRPEEIADAFIFNYRRYMAGLPVMYCIDWNVGY